MTLLVIITCTAQQAGPVDRTCITQPQHSMYGLLTAIPYKDCHMFHRCPLSQHSFRTLTVRLRCLQLPPGLAQQASVMQELIDSAAVTTVAADMIVHAVQGTQTGATWGLDRIDQQDLPVTTTYTYGGTAAGVTAYIIDTGVHLLDCLINVSPSHVRCAHIVLVEAISIVLVKRSPLHPSSDSRDECACLQLCRAHARVFVPAVQSAHLVCDKL